MRAVAGSAFLVLLFVGILAAQTTPQGANAVTVPRSEQVDLKGPSGQPYRLFIQAPPADAPTPPGGYPVYYFTDANASFALVASLARIQQPTIGPVVLVGIGYPTEERNEITLRRSFDLTPQASPDAMKRLRDARKGGGPTKGKGGSSAKGSTGSPKATESAPPAEVKYGGQAEFFAFVQSEVKPLIEKRFAIDKNRQALFGHSFGGLFTLHALFEHPESFQTYIAASPSLFLNPEKLAKDESAFVASMQRAEQKPRLLVTLGELEGRSPFDRSGPSRPGAPMNESTKGSPEKSPGTDAQSSGADPRAILASRLKDAGIDAAFKQFEGENHGSVVPFAHMRALRFAFESPTGERPPR